MKFENELQKKVEAMSGCKKCGGKGYVESWQRGAGSWVPNLKQCADRCNIKGYSDRVQKGFSKPQPEESGVVVEPNRNNVVSLFNGS